VKGRPVFAKNVCVRRGKNCQKLRHRYKKKKIVRKLVFPQPIHWLKKMKMPDGGFRPAFNVQLSTVTSSQIIVGVDVDHYGSDQGLLSPWFPQIHERLNKYPDEALNDGGFVNKKEIENCAASALSYTQKSLNPRMMPVRNESLCPKTACQSLTFGPAWALLLPKKFTKNEH